MTEDEAEYYTTEPYPEEPWEEEKTEAAIIAKAHMLDDMVCTFYCTDCYDMGVKNVTVGGGVKMNKTELKAVLDSHMKWLRNDPNGKRADLSGANLSGANLSGADLYRADLSGANLSGADLSRG